MAGNAGLRSPPVEDQAQSQYDEQGRDEPNWPCDGHVGVVSAINAKRRKCPASFSGTLVDICSTALGAMYVTSTGRE